MDWKSYKHILINFGIITKVKKILSLDNLPTVWEPPIPSPQRALFTFIFGFLPEIKNMSFST